MFGKMPSLKDLENPEADLASEIYSADGKLMGKYYTENRSEVRFRDISPNIINALIATEDERFNNHSGIDAEAVGRAVFTLGTQGGGSTITQQVAKMMLGQGKGNFFVRGMQKVKEWIVAVKLERNFTKDEILTLYLNRAAWGNVYGIRNASRLYFQKEPKDLKTEEAAVLVGMLKGFIYDPIRHPKASLDRRNIVLNQMAVCNQHYLSQQEADRLKAKPLITNYKKLDENIGIAPYFRDVLKDQLKTWCKTHVNPKTDEPYDLLRDGLKVYTTINAAMQQYAEEAVVKHMPEIQKKLNWSLKVGGNRMWRGHENVIEDAMKFTDRWKDLKADGVKDEDIKKTFMKPVRMKVFAWNSKREMDTVMTPYDSIKYHKQLMQTSFAAMDPRTGEVKCWVGGIDYRWFKYDHVTAKRQVGSTFKPFVYTLGIVEAGYTPETPIAGGGMSLGGKTVSSGGGTVASCLAYSKNIAPWRMIAQIGVKRTIEFVQNCGITTKIPPYYSIALGSAEIPMLEMLRGYTMFPNKGMNTEPILVTRIEDKNGNLLQEFQPATKQVISEADAFTMVRLMQGVIQFGTAKNLNAYNIPVQKAGKTGTTTGNTDGWFIGYTPELVAGTWVGCEDPFITIYSTSGGNEMAAPKWGIFMNKVYADKKLGYGKIKEFEKPTNLSNEVLQADATGAWERIFKRGDTTIIDEGNGDAGDFIDAPADGNDGMNEDVPIESDVNKKPDNTPTAPDTGKNKKPEVKMPDNKLITDVKVTDAKTPGKPTVTQADDKNKKPAKPAEKPKTNNDYR
jgi:penicillin-binding protein 1A